jgi:hypothetical protein
VTFSASAITRCSWTSSRSTTSVAHRGCHATGSFAPDLSTGNSRTSTVGVVSSCTPGTRVVAGSAATSVLYLRSSTTTTCGGPMPPGASVTLTAAQLKIIRAWINNGAPAN